MKRVSLVLMFFLAFTSFMSLNAQWARTYAYGSDARAKSIQQTSDGGYIVVGWTRPSSDQPEDIWILKLSQYGAVEWQKTYGGSGFDDAYSIQQTSDGGYIVAGRMSSFGAGSYDLWVLKLDSIGDIEWQKTYGGSVRDEAYSIQQTSDGGYIVAGRTLSFGAGGYDLLILKLSSIGGIEWQKTYGEDQNERAALIQQTNDGGYIVVGTTSYSYSMDITVADIWVLKLSSNGNIEWERTYGGPDQTYQSEWAASIKQTSDGGYIVAGYTKVEGRGTNRRDVWVLKLSVTGFIDWQRIYDGGPIYPFESPYAIEQTNEEGYIVAGKMSSSGAGSDDLWVLKLGPTGDIEWQKTYGGSGSEQAYSIQQTSDGGYIVAGFESYYEDKFLLVKLSSNGDIDSSCGDFIHESNAISSFTSITPLETNITPQNINMTTQNTNITPQETNAIVDLICEYTPSISGSVKTAGGEGIEGVDITFSNTGGTATTDSSGNYSNKVSYDWSGTATPSKAGYTFSPASRTYTNVTSDKTGEDYTATLITYTISGTMSIGGSGLSGVAMNGLPGNPTTDASGNYSAAVDYDWSGTVTPSKAGYTFSPASRTYTNVTSDQTAQDYTAILNTYTLTTEANPTDGGNITKNPDQTLYTHGVTVELTANINTGYTFTSWTGDVPSGHENDNPLTITMDSNKTLTANFTLKTYTISGTVTFGGSGLEGVLIDGLPGDPTSDNSGYYTSTVDYGWLGTATPSKAGYNFSPSSRTYANVTADQTGQDYTVIIYTLTTQINPSAGGSITKNPDKPLYKQGENVELTANANSGYTFTGWTGDVPAGHESDNPVTITIDTDKSITANFWKKGPCFIATAAYGSPLHYYVRILQEFRDKYLMPSKLGSKLVKLYYKYSPFAADFIAKNKVLKVVVRISLLPLVVFSYSMLHFGLVFTTFMFLFVSLLPILPILFCLRRIRRVEAR